MSFTIIEIFITLAIYPEKKYFVISIIIVEKAAVFTDKAVKTSFIVILTYGFNGLSPPRGML